jgi:heme exporter protein CcmD
MSGFGPHGFYIAMAYGAAAVCVVAEVLAVRARRRRAIAIALQLPPATLTNPAGGA